jgi:hypothetical protein
MPRHPTPNIDALKRAGDLAAAPRVAGGWRRFESEEIARLHRLYYDPKVRVSKIAGAFGVSSSTLLRWIDEMDWPCRRQMKRDAITAMHGVGARMRAAAPDNAAFGAAGRDAGAINAEAAYGARVAQGLEAVAEEARAEAAVEAATARRAAAPDEAVVRHLCRPSSRPSPRAREEGDASEERREEAIELSDVAPEDFAALCTTVGEATLREIGRVKARPGDAGQNARTLASLVRTLAALEDLRGKRGDPKGAMPGGAPPRPTRSLAELREDIGKRLAAFRAERAAKEG